MARSVSYYDATMKTFMNATAMSSSIAWAIFTAAACLAVLTLLLFITSPKTFQQLRSYWSFFMVSFLKPHSGDGKGCQQAALESFYESQAHVYDTTRKRLLRGREEMLAMVASQLQHQQETATSDGKPLWIDLGGGTGWNIEVMSRFRDVPSSFSKVYLVDLSPSLCAVAQQRFERLGWKNVEVVCEDASRFHLNGKRADVITMSYSLSMMPNFYTVIDSASSLLSKNAGIIAVCDFYVQSIVDIKGRNYVGSCLQRHVNWIGRSFWRAWFDLDRVGLEGARRDYLEYRFGTLKAVDERNYILGSRIGPCIPYYIFLGRHVSSTSSEVIEQLDASWTEAKRSPRAKKSNSPVRSKAFDTAIVNLSTKLPLPSAFYQNKHHRILYDETLAKHEPFTGEFIYAFTWEDSRVDMELLDMKTDDAVLCITSAGDNLLDYIYSCKPRRVHAVDLNPNQNHLLELKVAAYQALPYADFWKLFGEGRHSDFREILIRKLSPYMSSHAFQYWWYRSNIFTSKYGLYEHGGSGVAVRLIRIALQTFGLQGTVDKFLAAQSLDDQHRIWPAIRGILMNRFFHWGFLGSGFWWKAAGVPPNQVELIAADCHEKHLDNTYSSRLLGCEGEAMWQYLQDTLDPVAQDTLIGRDNHYYLLPLLGHYTQRCHPSYLTPDAHASLSKPGAFDSLRIHTDEIKEVISRILPGSLDIAIVMDSMDWFDPDSPEARVQVEALNRVLNFQGRVFFRSAGLKPWYVQTFEDCGFQMKNVGNRTSGKCIDRVNMYASAWIATKVKDVDR